MMIKTVVGDLLDATEDIIVQQVNCRSVMGSGVAKAIYTRWPEVKTEYHKFCRRSTSPYDLLGKVQLIDVEPGKAMVIIRSGIEMAGAQLNTALRKTGRILLTRFHGLRHCHLFTTPQRLSSVMPAYPTPCCKITARKIFCGDATGFGRIRKSEKSKLYLDTHQGLTEEPTQSQQETYVLMLGVYTMAAYVRSSSKTTDKAPVCM